MSDDLQHMRAALALARRGLGNAWPNPAVGCVLVRHGEVVGRGWTQPGGRPHAETEALRRAGSKARRRGSPRLTAAAASPGTAGRQPPCNGTPVAAQIWIVGEGKASIYKVAYHKSFASLSLPA